MIDGTAVGLVAQRLGVKVRLLRQLAAELQISPVLRLNGIDHFAAGDINRLRCKISGEAANDEPLETETPTNG